MSQSLEHARLLMEKALEDQDALERLANMPDMADAVVGFHAQQAVEKMLKAVLTRRGISYGRTHDLENLLNLLERNGIAQPSEPEKIAVLSPFAVEYRYDRLPPEEQKPQALDRKGAVECVRRVKTWALQLVETAP